MKKKRNIEFVEKQDVDQIKIKKVLFFKEHPDILKDLIVEFPDRYGIEPISFMEIGLINALPAGIDYTSESTDETPIVNINFYGKLEEVVCENPQEN